MQRLLNVRFKLNKSLWVIALTFLLVSCSTPVLLKSNEAIDLMAQVNGKPDDDNRWYGQCDDEKDYSEGDQCQKQ